LGLGGGLAVSSCFYGNVYTSQQKKERTFLLLVQSNEQAPHISVKIHLYSKLVTAVSQQHKHLIIFTC